MWYPQMRSRVVRPETQLNPPFSVSGVPLEILDDLAVEPAPQRVLAGTPEGAGHIQVALN